MMINTFSITDLEGFADTVRNGAATSLCEGYTENVDDYITIPQIVMLIAENNLGLDEEENYVITEELFDIIFESVRKTIYQSALAKLASKNTIQCAWDSEMNDMVFWLDSKDKNIPISPEPSK